MIQEAIDQGLLAAIWTRPVRRLQRAPVKAGRNGPKSAVSRLVWGVNVAFGINVLDQRMVRRVTCLLPSVDPADRGGARALIREQPSTTHRAWSTTSLRRSIGTYALPGWCTSVEPPTSSR
jgi:hypothetical protein